MCVSFMFILASCGTFVHGTSTKVTIETDKTTDDSVNIVAIGPKKIVEYKNVSLPFKMKVKHNNLPLRVSMSSNKDKYDPFTIKAVRKGKAWASFGKLVGWSSVASGAGVAVALGEAEPICLGFAGFGAALIGLCEYAETDIPDNRHYLTSSTPNINNEVWYRRLNDIQDIYTLLQEENYILAEAKSRWLIEGGESGELYYLKGMSNYYLGEYKQAIEDLKQGLYLVEPEQNPGLRTEIIECLESAEDARRIKKEKRQQLWANIASGVLQTGAAVYQTYAQNDYYRNLEKSGLSPTGEVIDPSKLSKEQLNQLIDPRFAMQQVYNKEMMEYQEFCRFNRKEDGSLYTFDEFQALKGEALLELKKQGIDLVAEQNERNRQANKEWREGLERDRQERLDKAKAVINGEPYRGSSSTTSSSSITSNNSVATITTPVVSSSVSKVSKTNSYEQEKLDSKQQFKNDPVSSENYEKVKTVTLYIRDGNKARVMMNNVELCRKGAYYYIKIGKTYYKRMASDWQMYRNAIVYGHHPLYYND